MSRSYKKNPVFKTAPSDGTFGKNQANRRIRRFKGDLSDGCEYKKHYETWNIHDCIWRETLNEALESRNRFLSEPRINWFQHDEEYLNINKYIKKWKKDFYWK